MAWVLHPFIFALFRVLSFYAHNVETVAFRDAAAYLLLIPGSVAVLWLVLIPIIKNPRKRGLLLTLLLFLFILYDPLTELLLPLNKLAGQRYLPINAALTLLILILPGIVAATKILKTGKDLARPTRILNIIACCAVAMPLATIAYQTTLGSATGEFPTPPPPVPGSPSLPGQTATPDIYYIVLDGYARADVFKTMYDGDNSQFLDHLRAKGFYIADESLANYCQTYLSLASSLNFTYLDSLAAQLGRESKSRRPLKIMIQENAVANFLRQQGYVFVTFNSGYSGTRNPKADVYIQPNKSMSEFQQLLNQAVPIPGVSVKSKKQHDLHRARHLFILDTLAHMPEREEPQFVFAHIVCPHPPFLFAQDGSYIMPKWKFTFADGNAYMRYGNKEGYIRKYREQLIYISTRVQETVDAILERSPQSVIILQGDHGPGSELNWRGLDKTNPYERMAILNAYYLPNGGHTLLYPAISPVNTFRIVLNHYFGTEFDLLEDKSYYSIYNRPYQLQDVTKAARSPLAGHAM